MTTGTAPQHTEVVIIGGGSAGLSALRQVQNRTDDVYLIADEPLGTTCARTGCMPSKALIALAERCRGRDALITDGLLRSRDDATVDLPSVLARVRELRDGFATGMVEATKRLAGERLLIGRARFTGPDTVAVGDKHLRAEKIIVATGARPMVPGPWRRFGDRVLTSATIFEQHDLPPRLAVIGLGAIGLELGTALAHLGREVVGFDMQHRIAGLNDPAVNRAAIDALSADLPMTLGQKVDVSEDDGNLVISAGDTRHRVDALICAMGTRPDLADLDLEAAGVEPDERGMPPLEASTLRIPDTVIHLIGDANARHPLLHEAVDDGYIVGRETTNPQSCNLCRRTPLRLVFSAPQIAVVGSPMDELEPDSFVTGTVDLADQGRAKAEGENRGLIHIYLDRDTRTVRGAEMVGPQIEHLAHYLALAIGKAIAIDELLVQPIYHPTLFEGLRSALRHAAAQLPGRHDHRRPPICGGDCEDPLT
jgi:dihydrolipoamide dehydrogenase